MDKIKSTEDIISDKDINDYEKFLYLFKKYGREKNTILVPTLKIDTIWHAHMLDHKTYVEDTRDLLGYVLDHNDALPEKDLRMQFKRIAELWEKEYKKSYRNTREEVPKQQTNTCSTVIYAGHDSDHHSESPHSTHGLNGDISDSWSSCGSSCGSGCGGGD